MKKPKKKRRSLARVNALRVQTLMAVLDSQRAIDNFLLQFMDSIRAKGFSVTDLKEAANQMAELHKKRYHAMTKEMTELINKQSVVHAREIAELSFWLGTRTDALRTAIQLIKVARCNEWTPANTQELIQIVAVVHE